MPLKSDLLNCTTYRADRTQNTEHRGTGTHTSTQDLLEHWNTGTTLSTGEDYTQGEREGRPGGGELGEGEEIEREEEDERDGVRGQVGRERS